MLGFLGLGLVAGTAVGLVLAVVLAVLVRKSNTTSTELGNDALDVLAVDVLIVILVVLVIEVHGYADDPQSCARNLVVLIDLGLGAGVDSGHGDAELDKISTSFTSTMTLNLQQQKGRRQPGWADRQRECDVRRRLREQKAS